MTATIDAERVRLALALRDYRADRVRVQDGGLGEATHVVASRNGLFLVWPGGWRVLMHGQFFGLTFVGGDLLAFEACARPRDPAETGRVIRLRRRGDAFAEGEVVARGLDNGCHGMDVVDGRLLLVDTYRQRIVTMRPDGCGLEIVEPFEVSAEGRFAPEDPRYLHANSLLAVGERTLVLLHRGWAHTGRMSEVAVFDREWRPLGRMPVSGRGCHDLAVLRDGTLLVCDSLGGALVGTDGRRVAMGTGMTRGLAAGADGLVVGSSAAAAREDRLGSRGMVRFLDWGYRVLAEVELPGAPTMIRRLDGVDFGLSGYLAGIGQGLRSETWA